ncbi:MAG: transporter substrate-binding domain-containing protein [Candidatus Deferrimicrobiaceae bacterium]
MNFGSRLLVALTLAMALVVNVSVAGEKAPHRRTLVVGTKEAPPFSMKAEDGTWTGISIDLWSEIAAELDLAFEFRETDLQGLLDGITDRSLDFAVAALTVTSEREKAMDFTHPFYHTGLGIAVAKKSKHPWLHVFRGFFSFDMLQLIVGVFLLSLFIGSLVYWFERKKNPKHFGGGIVKGIGSGAWWSVVTMTTVGYGDKTPITFGGRALAFLWMLVCLVLIALLTAHITSSLTLIQMTSGVKGPEDLVHVRVGSVADTTSSDYLRENRIPFYPYKTASEGLRAIAEGKIEALVYDKPILQYLIRKEFPGDLEVLPTTFRRQDYGIALTAESPLREPINVVLLKIIRAPAWQGTLTHYLGR